MQATPERLLDDGTMVAREEEVAVLRQAVAAARAGRGRLVVVNGAPGSGRTRLVHEAAALAREQGMQVVWLPNDGDGGATVIEEVLRTASRSGVVLVADDGPVVDGVRFALLASIARVLRSLPVLALVTRTELAGLLDRSDWAGEMEREALHLRLRPFRPGTVIALAARMGAIATIPVLERLHAATGGNALLVVETLSALCRVSGRDDGAPWPLSEDALRWARTRLDALPSTTRDAVEVASALGQECDVALVAQVMQSTLDPAPLGALLAESGFLLTPSGRACCRFAPPLTRNLVYASLLRSRRRDLHERAATMIGADGSTSPTQVAHHGLAALAADDFSSCEQHLLRLAEQRASPATPASPTGWPYFVREGDAWAIGYGDRAVRLHDRAGLRYVARLLSRPCVEFAALALAERLRGRNGIDPQGPAMIAERARVRVTRRIRDAIARIADVHPELGAHLERTIHTGIRCTYVVDSERAPCWEVRFAG